VPCNQPIQTSVSPTYTVLPRPLEARVCVQLIGRGTPVVHGKTNPNKHMRFQSVRLVGAVGIENNAIWNFKDLQGMLGSTKALIRNNRECKGILIGPLMAPRFICDD
jgi:hypothetical protein